MIIPLRNVNFTEKKKKIYKLIQLEFLMPCINEMWFYTYYNNILDYDTYN